MVESAGAAEKKGCGLVSIIVGISVVGVLCAALLPLWFMLQGYVERVNCSGNLKTIGQASQAWALSHQQTWPCAYTQDSTRWDDVGNTRTDPWNAVHKDDEPPQQEAGDNGQPVQSNTASLWRLLAEAGLDPQVFVCPTTRHWHDAVERDKQLSLRDFRSETFVSYSYQNVLGPYKLRQTSARIPAQFAVAADANPLRQDFWSGAPGNKNLSSASMWMPYPGEQFVPGGEADNWNAQGKRVEKVWETNSPNHHGWGQNVLYLDGHVEWRTDPYCGTNYDNIWLRRRTDVTAPVDPKNIETLRAYNDETSYDGKSTLPEDSKDDSFLVP